MNKLRVTFANVAPDGAVYEWEVIERPAAPHRRRMD